MSEKKLGFGLMRLPLTDSNNSGSIDYPHLEKMVDTFMEQGFNYFDTAWMYHGGKSECAVKEVLVKRYPRDSFTVTSKLPGYKLHSFEDRDKVFNIQRERTGLEYFDYYFLHEISTETIKNFNKYDCFTWLREKKEQGLVKHIGFSYHDGPELLDKVLTEHPEFEVVQLQINYLDWDSAGVQSRACYEVAVKHGKQVIVMEPVKGGTLANVSDEVKELFHARDKSMSIASWAIRFAASLENVMMVLSGMSNMDQLLDNTAYMADFKPLTGEEFEVCLQAAKIINRNIAIPCTGCEYCVVECPKNIAIPKYFSLYNAEQQEISGKPWTAQMIYFDSVAAAFGKPSECIKCGRCEALCPQHLPIRKWLDKVADYFE